MNSSAVSAPGGPIRPLAQDHVVVAASPDPQTMGHYTPAIARLKSGRLVAAYERGGKIRLTGEPWAFILTSDDGGQTWTQRHAVRISHARLFVAGGAVYYLGHAGPLWGDGAGERADDLSICRSTDDGGTWSKSVPLTTGQMWHATATNVWHAKGNVYLVMERRGAREITGWCVGELMPVLMRAREDADLTRRENWTFASELMFADLVPGYRENRAEFDYHGIPFYPQAYPTYTLPGPNRGDAPMGWLETNVVQVLDPKHYWYDPAGRTFHLLMRGHTGGSGYAALAKVVENADGTMTTMLETVPSGRKVLWLAMPGGHLRIHVLYDEVTQLYWLLGSQATDSMTRAELLPDDRYNLPNNERHRLVLHFSRNLVDWCFAGVVAIGASAKQSRNYACMDIDGDDLVITSRSGDEQARNAHDTNLITFHRVKDFRTLVY